MNLYFYDGKKLSGKASEHMAIECVKAYIDEFGEPEAAGGACRDGDAKDAAGGSGPNAATNSGACGVLNPLKTAPASKWQVAKGPHGKPYLPNVNLEYNVSHSGLLWVCAVSENPVGIDIQEIKEKDYEAIAKRFFTREEFHYTELWGSDGFFDLWVRKEAFVKYLGKGFSAAGGFGGFSLLDEKGDLKAEASLGEDKGCFMIPDMGFDIKCAICMAQEEEINIRPVG